MDGDGLIPFSEELEELESAGDTMIGALGEELLLAEFDGELTAVALEPFERWLFPIRGCSSLGKLVKAPLLTISVILSKYTSKLRKTS